MKRTGLFLALALPFAGCANVLTPAQTGEAQLAVKVVAASNPVAGQIIADGQLVCAGAGEFHAIIDAVTGKPYVVTGKPATTVHNICLALGATPVADPGPAVPIGVATIVPVAGVSP